MHLPVVYPRPLKNDANVVVISPSSPQREDAFLQAGIDWFRQRGYQVTEGSSLWHRHGYLAGADTERLEELNSALQDPTVDLIVAGRGGYGAGRILEGIDYEAARRNRPIILGFSDVTAINLAMLAKAGLLTLSGAMPGVDLRHGADSNPFAVDSLLRATSSRIGELPTAPSDTAAAILIQGIAEGRLVPVNLTLLASLCGTPFLPSFKGAILLVEEIGEEVYRLDRLFGQLANAGIFDEIAGLALGRFTGTDPKRISVDPLPFDEMIADYVKIANVPTVSGFPYGHVPTKWTVPVGAMARLDASSESPSLTILEEHLRH